jgi:hypothetical protein
VNSIEERLALDIAAVTKGVVVTERDLLEARDAIDERADTGRRRDRRRTVALVAAAAVVVAGAGAAAFGALGGDNGTVVPAGPGPTVDVYEEFLKGDPPTPEALNGFWRVDNGTTMVRFQEDGIVQFSDGGAVISDPVTIGTYTIEGDTITVSASEAPGCITGEWTMRAALPEPGIANLVLSDSQFGTCQKIASTIALHQVVPTGSILAEMDNSGLRGWQPVTDEKWLRGDWVAEGGGYLLEIAKDGSYYIVDDSADAVDNGRWRYRGSALELFSRDESPQCKEGDWLRLVNLEQANPGTTMIRGNVETNDCGGTWTPDTWIRIPDSSPSDASGN